MTRAQVAAINWLSEHGGDGMFDKSGVLLAAGERAPFKRATWNALRDMGRVEMYGGPRGRSRVRVKP